MLSNRVVNYVVACCPFSLRPAQSVEGPPLPETFPDEYRKWGTVSPLFATLTKQARNNPFPYTLLQETGGEGYACGNLAHWDP